MLTVRLVQIFLQYSYNVMCLLFTYFINPRLILKIDSYGFLKLYQPIY